MAVTFIMPVRDDWTSARELVRRLDRTLTTQEFTVDVLLIDDGSIRGCEPAEFRSAFEAVRSIRVVQLRRNVGHQRAIAIGLGYASTNVRCDALVVMDADGEDTPEGALAMLLAFRASGGEKAIFAERVRRSESLQFKMFYKLYRLVHLILTGIKVRVGNFSVLPFRYLSTLAVLSELWNHYAAAIFNSKLPYSMFPVPRGTRIDGASQMNFIALVAHGLSAISVFGDRVGVRMLIGSLGGAALAFVGILVAVSVRLFSSLAIPGWATYAIGTLIVILMQMITIAASFTFFMLSNRMNLGFIPMRDYPLFVASIMEVYPHE
jgi:glycosyltransferase involved in cell wall biosynthesis